MLLKLEHSKKIYVVSRDRGLSWYRRHLPWFARSLYVYGDGFHDDDAFNEAIGHLPKNPGGKVTALEGQFNISDTIKQNKDAVQLEGMGLDATTLKLINDVNKTLLAIKTDADLRVWQCGVKDMTIDGNRANNLTAPNLVDLIAGRFLLENLWLKETHNIALNSTPSATDWTNGGIIAKVRCTRTGEAPAFSAGVNFDGRTVDNWLHLIETSGFKRGIWSIGNNNTFNQCYLDLHEEAMKIHSGERLIDSFITNHTLIGLQFHNEGEKIIILGNHFSSGTAAAKHVYVAPDDGHILKKINIDDNIMTGVVAVAIDIAATGTIEELAIENNQLHDAVVKITLPERAARIENNIGFIDDQEVRPIVAQALEIYGDVRAVWPFRELTGVTSEDWSRRGHDLAAASDLSTWGIMPWYKGKATIYTFGGIAAEILDTPDHADFSFGNGAQDQAFSIGILVNVASGAMTFLSKHDTNTPAREWMLHKDGSDLLKFELWDNVSGAIMQRYYNVAMSANVWHMIVATYDASAAVGGIKFYLDGIRVDNNSYTNLVYTAMADTGAEVAVGYYTGGGGTPTSFLSGKAALPFITGKELSADEVWSLWQLCRGLLDV